MARQLPLAVVVGASITQGVGAMCPVDAWPYLLAGAMGWRLAVSGVSGAGYVRTVRAGGPFLNQLRGLHVLEQGPSIVILQGGHNDVGESTAALRRRVTATVGMVRHEAPQAKLVLLTVFPGGIPTKAQRRADNTIVSAARRADPHVLIVDPIAQHWHYPTIKDHLHPTDAGYRWIAQRMERDLRSDGIKPTHAQTSAKALSPSKVQSQAPTKTAASA
jgi:lysophospholipase L1-like esterase